MNLIHSRFSFKNIFLFLALGFGIVVLASHIPWHTPVRSSITASIADSIEKYKLNTQKVKIIISKLSYELKLIIDGRLVKTYPVVLGPDPVNDKTHEGDGCTPEGSYKIKAKYPHRSWSYFLWIDYPNTNAWKRFNENKRNGTISKNASIGGDIGIHGVPGKEKNYLIDNKVNWTLGCISLKTEDITEIYKYVPVGAEVEITP